MKREDLLDLNDVLQHPGRVLSVDISTELEEEADVDLVRPLEGFLEAVSTGNLLLVTGEFKTRLVIECARCSGPLELDLEFEIDEQFPVEGVPSSLSAQDFAKVVPDEPFELFDENQLMVENLLRQGLLLAMPLAPLCEFGWEGDCPVAAARGVGKREVTATRPEFQSLADLLKPEEDAP
ncbi:MAG: YceD family protein [Fimbriimonas sp.]